MVSEGVHMIGATPRQFPIAFVGSLIVLAIAVGQGAFSSLPARSRALRPAVRLAYVQQGNIWVLDATSGRRMRLTGDGHDSAPLWTSNGQALLFQRQASMRPQIWRWQLGRGIRRLREGLWSPDGKHIAFARGLAATPSTRLTNVQLIASRRLFLMDANGAQLHRLTNLPGWTDEAPVWSPDGHLLIFVRWRRHLGSQAAAAALWAVRADGTGAQRLAPLDLPSGFLNGFGYYGSFGWHDLFAVAP
jgi:Tol biopolymer transport system component